MKNWKLLLILLAAAAMLSLAFVACAEAGEAETKTVYVDNTPPTTTPPPPTPANYSFRIVGIKVSGLDVVLNGDYQTDKITEFNPGDPVYPNGTNFVINGTLWGWEGGWDAISNSGSAAKGTIVISDGKGEVTFAEAVNYPAGSFFADTKIAFTGNRNIGNESVWDLKNATYDFNGTTEYVLSKRVVNPGKPSGTGIISYVEVGNEKGDVTVNVPNASGDYIINGIVTKKDNTADIWIALFKAEKDFKDPSADTWTGNFPEFVYSQEEATALINDNSVDYKKLTVNAYEWTWFLTKK